MTSNDIVLLGAPDMQLGTPQSKSKPVQAMQLTMTSDVLEELLECVKSGKPPQILFGGSPMLRYNGKSLALESHVEKYRHELYTEQEEEENEWEFAAVINHSLAIRPAEDPSAGMDLALETLKSRMAAERMAREANKTIISTPELKPNSRPQMASRSNLLKPKTSSSTTSSPGSIATKSPAYQSPPRSAPADSDMFLKAGDPYVRQALIHVLASQPRSVKDCRIIAGFYKQKHTAPNDRIIKDTLKTIAMCNDPTNITAKWTLLDKSYKELTPYDIKNFEWPTPEEGEKAIDNAIRAFDRMRIPKDDPQWQKLLPRGQRGRGIVLSRLKLQEGASQGKPLTATSSGYDKRTGLPKKSAAKKAAEKKEEKPVPTKVEKPAEKSKLAKESESAAKADSKPKPTVKSARPGTGNGVPSKSPAMAESGRARSTSNLSSASKGGTNRDIKPSTAAKSLLNKPRNPSPLSKSPPVNASDFGLDHPVHKKLSAAASPAKKRKIDEVDSDAQRNGAAAKRQHLRTPSGTERPKTAKPSLNGSSTGSKKEANGTTASLKRKAGDIDSDSSKQSTPSKLRKVEAPLQKPNGVHGSGSSKVGATAKKHPSPDTETSSDDSKPLKLTWKQALEMALRYEQYYPHYYSLYMEISSAENPPLPEKREQLQKMHNKLKIMKDQIAEASWRGKEAKVGGT